MNCTAENTTSENMTNWLHGHDLRASARNDATTVAVKTTAAMTADAMTKTFEEKSKETNSFSDSESDGSYEDDKNFQFCEETLDTDDWIIGDLTE